MRHPGARDNMLATTVYTKGILLQEIYSQTLQIILLISLCYNQVLPYFSLAGPQRKIPLDTYFWRETTLHTLHDVIRCEVYKQNCLSGECIKEWDSKKEDIFNVSKMVCAGSELGWDFTNRVTTSKQTFSGFVKTYSMIYQ